MGFFSDILEKLGVGNGTPADAAAPSLLEATPDEALDDGASVIDQLDDGSSVIEESDDEESDDVTPVALVDVVAHLEELADANPQDLNWKTSIVDLLKLLGLDSSLDARKELATELDCDEHVMADSARMNTWLHKEVLARIAANGGNIPEHMLS